MRKPDFPKCPSCTRTALTWYVCAACGQPGCQRCWASANKTCPTCEHPKKKLVHQKFDLGEPRLLTWLTFNKHGEYIPFLALDRVVSVMGLVDKPVVKASAALLVGAFSFVGLRWHLDKIKLLAACLGMVLPAVYLACHILKKPLARWLSRAMDYRGGTLAKLHSEGHFRVPIEDLSDEVGDGRS